MSQIQDNVPNISYVLFLLYQPHHASVGAQYDEYAGYCPVDSLLPVLIREPGRRQDKMFSSISSYIRGQDDQGQGKESTASLPPSREVNDWVVVGEFKHRNDRTKGGTNKEVPCEQKPQTHSSESQSYGKKHLQSMMFGEMTPVDRVMNSRGLSRYNMWEERNHQARQSPNIKMAGINKNLKQC